MSDRELELAARRETLRATSAIQREHLGRTVQDIEARLAGIDRGIDIARSVVRRPIVLGAGVALITLIGPRRLMRIIGRSAVLFATGRRVMRLLGQR